MDWTAFLALAGLFASAFTSATFLPGTSEAALIALKLAEAAPSPALFLVATAGNVGGSCLNWWLGGQINRFRDRSWFPVGPDKMASAEYWFGRFGPAILLMSWVPLAGDALTVAAGALKVPLALFVPFVAIGKGWRYAAILWLIS